MNIVEVALNYVDVQKFVLHMEVTACDISEM